MGCAHRLQLYCSQTSTEDRAAAKKAIYLDNQHTSKDNHSIALQERATRPIISGELGGLHDVILQFSSGIYKRPKWPKKYFNRSRPTLNWPP